MGPPSGATAIGATAGSSSSRPYNNNRQQQQQQQSQSQTGNNAPPPASQPTPLFERLVTEEVQELKAYARIIETQNKKLVVLERTHGDLESRLELESRGRTQLESTLERRERDWAMKYLELEKDRDQWKTNVSQEQTKNARLIDQVVRKDQDIHRMLQRKVSHNHYQHHYQNQHHKQLKESGTGHSIRNVRHSERQVTPPRTTQHQDPPQRYGLDLNKSPHEILATTGSMETVRIRNVKNLLADFFAF
ncbi:hypothetical protein FRACYDRAFT_188928 [Fragilariopsis cylindrus CCMP1102]|uniref:Uncharacterized protein n=1 Tax=Fragilariopsis cylindrus CCMP1102 TaxID=635003 RepID=A0A1E7F644_9STRA|nr:hypothetical protein FRACYDRAFT_188928 [Fragilariopsis cylindrus CCMP1102]|eukprot:OEU13627.1 hypothetical protein FRACYDRAFT_188928 [Fragilariopsis cylindrus CCMP1102]